MKLQAVTFKPETIEKHMREMNQELKQDNAHVVGLFICQHSSEGETISGMIGLEWKAENFKQIHDDLARIVLYCQAMMHMLEDNTPGEPN